MLSTLTLPQKDGPKINESKRTCSSGGYMYVWILYIHMCVCVCVIACENIQGPLASKKW